MKIIFASFLILVTTLAFAQHREPNGRIITFETPDGRWGRAYAVDAQPDGDEYILLFTNGTGLNANMKYLADRFARDIGNIHVYLVDLYDAKVADTPEEFTKLETGLSSSRSEAIVKGIMDFIAQSAEVGLIGYGSGAKWAMQAGMMAENRVQGIVLFNEIPSIDPDNLVMLDSDVLAVMAMPEDEMNMERINKFKDLMNEVDYDLIVERYDSSGGQPLNDFKDGPLEDAYERAFVFLQRRIN